jgi:hypothetical protein
MKALLNAAFESAASAMFNQHNAMYFERLGKEIVGTTGSAEVEKVSKI